MKNLLIIPITLCLILSGCKDDGPTPTPLSKVVQENGTIHWDGELVATFTAVSTKEVGTVEFKSDSTFKSDIAYTSTTSLNFGGTVQDQTSDIPQTVTTGTFSYDSTSKVFIVTNSVGGVKQEAEMLELTSTKLVYKSKIYQKQTQNGVVNETRVDVITTMTK
jgi:hypothetical protein